MKKYKFFIDYDKEEKWLNDMAKEGYQLEEVSFGYKFRNAEPEDTIIRIDYRTFKSEEDFIDYCTLFEDSGWKHISGTKYSGAQYFKKINNSSENDIFSDKLSKAGKYKRVSDMWGTISIAYLPILVVLMTNKAININAIIHPKSLYYTPGLWEMSGIKFWRCFLFETPFAVSRGFMWLFFLVILVLYLSFSIKAKILYNKQKNSKATQ